MEVFIFFFQGKVSWEKGEWGPKHSLSYYYQYFWLVSGDYFSHYKKSGKEICLDEIIRLDSGDC